MIGLDARLRRRIHEAMTIDVALAFGLETAILFGPSGAGKTSVLRMIAGLDRPRSGHVRIGEETLFDSDRGIDLPLRSRRVGLIFQGDLLFPHLSVGRNIGFGLGHLDRGARARRISEVSSLCGVETLLDRLPFTLSGGERQRVGLARSLAPRPRLLLCDEPVSALDLDGRSALIDRLLTVQAAESIPVLYVTHSPGEAIALGSTLYLMERGAIVAEGRPLDVLSANRVLPGSHLERLRNVFRAAIAENSELRGETHLRLDGGPTLIVPLDRRPVGASLSVSVAADEILLSTGILPGLSARNQLPGVVDRVVPRGPDAEVVVRTGSISWIVSVTASAVSELGLEAEKDVKMIIKARSCRLIARRDSSTDDADERR